MKTKESIEMMYYKGIITFEEMLELLKEIGETAETNTWLKYALDYCKQDPRQ